MKIVSFYAPRPNHPLFQDYTPYLKTLDDSCKKFGFEHIVLSDAKIAGLSTFQTELPDALMPAFIKAQRDFLLSKPDDDVIFVGADCVIANDPSEIFDGSFDIGITTHNFSDCWFNSGAIFIPKETDASPIWEKALEICGETWGDDQLSLAEQFKPLTLEHGIYQRGDYRIGFFPVDPWNLAPNTPEHDCSHAKILHFRGKRKRWMGAYCEKYLGLTDHSGKHMWAYRGAGNVPRNYVIENMRRNCARSLNWLVPIPAHKQSMVIIGGGPSLKETLPAIKARAKRGQKTFALNNAWRALPFIPDAIVCMDSRPENAEFFKDAPDTTYFIASCAHPSVFEALEGKKVIVWHAAQGIPFEEDTVLEFQNGRCPVMLGGGGTVGLRTMSIGYALGFRSIHLYGMDSSYSGREHHAYEQRLNDGEDVTDITPEGMTQTYYCARWMARQAHEFQQMLRGLQEKGCFIQAHGYGLLPDLYRHISKLAKTA